MTASPYVFPGLKYNYLTEEQRVVLFRTLPPYRLAGIIKGTVAKYFNIPEENLHIKSQKGVLPWARQVSCFLIKEITHLSDNEIAYIIKRDRSTVSTNIKTVRDNTQTYPEYMEQLVDLRLQVKNAIAYTKYSIGQKTVKGIKSK
jgi:hypothetical protein